MTILVFFWVEDTMNTTVINKKYARYVKLEECLFCKLLLGGSLVV